MKLPVPNLMGLLIVSICMPLDGTSKEKPTAKARKNAPVFKKLHKGINIDTALSDSGVWPKIQHDVTHFKAAVDAGFDSVRVFLPVHANYESTEQQIKDALSNKLAIVVCMWGSSVWATNPQLGEQQIADKWRKLAEVWKKYPNDLVFEILNEPRGLVLKKLKGRRK